MIDESYHTGCARPKKKRDRNNVIRSFVFNNCSWEVTTPPAWTALSANPKNHSILKLVFSQFQEIHVTDSGGQSVILSFVLNAFVGALALRFIVGRTKLCLDFSCTFHFVHLIICWFYNASFPSTFSWWFLNAICVTTMCVAGEFLCLKIEMKEIPVGYTALDTKADL